MPIMHQKTFQELCAEITEISHIEPISLEKVEEMNVYMKKVHEEYVNNQNITRTNPEDIIFYI